MKRILRATLAAAVFAAIFVPGAARAETTETMNVSIEQNILWVEVDVSQELSGDRLRVAFLAPKAGKGHMVWQRCSFPNSGAGTYRCGIDVNPGSIASARKGHWMAKAAVGRDALGSLKFSL